ncbi:HAD family hydrolase [Stygiolobus caldivivus]|uniref:2-haloalkanoic acid dehalogenase n=1 Tax=Stygiolobus caldivivus TaxID=2824673 RepID=A0A8D5U7D0_9CREN|nr:HAD family hydrolase [Stygiolobus caldivivus]BCU70916.1 2-haloalkanoic acid dehalogenase [Stygiolobus caldivivus]
MYVILFNVIDSLIKPEEKFASVVREIQCVINGYSLSRVYVSYSSILDTAYKEWRDKLIKSPLYEDSLFLEELSYRARIYIVTNLDKMSVKQLLVRNNLDVFVQDVISSEDVKRYKPSREFFEYVSKKVNSPIPSIMLISSNPYDVLVAKSLNMKAHWLNRKGEVFIFPSNLQPDSVIKSIKSIAESTAQHKVDSSMGDSALRCS